MPEPHTSVLPPPKSWDEFEALVWNLYKDLWNDPSAQRYGRSGQAQQGVDIYGHPEKGRGQYVGIQCKCIEDGTLTRPIIIDEVAKADAFEPPLAEFLIATTQRRDARLQKAVRQLNDKRRSLGKFPVQIVFWDDICDELIKPQHHELLSRHYAAWAKYLRAQQFHYPSCAMYGVKVYNSVTMLPLPSHI